MQIPAPTNVSTATDPVRQQLDELDAFLQRMLGLPVQPGPDGEASVSRPPTQSAIRSDDPKSSPPDAFVVPAANTAPSTFVPRQAPPLPPADVAQPVRPQPSPDADVESFPLEHQRRYANLPTPGLWLWPIVGINKAYDGPTYFLGSAGPWLRDSGRSIVGWLGLGLIALATAWVAVDWLTWKW